MEKVGELLGGSGERERALGELGQNRRDRLRKGELLSFQVRELEQAKLEAGEDALDRARWLIRMASEDIGLADPNAWAVAVATARLCGWTVE